MAYLETGNSKMIFRPLRVKLLQILTLDFLRGPFVRILGKRRFTSVEHFDIGPCSDDIASDLDSDFEEMDGDFDNEFGNIQGPPEHPTRLGEPSNYIRYGCTNLKTLSNSWEDPLFRNGLSHIVSHRVGGTFR